MFWAVCGIVFSPGLRTKETCSNQRNKKTRPMTVYDVVRLAFTVFLSSDCFRSRLFYYLFIYVLIYLFEIAIKPEPQSITKLHTVYTALTVATKPGACQLRTWVFRWGRSEKVVHQVSALERYNSWYISCHH